MVVRDRDHHDLVGAVLLGERLEAGAHLLRRACGDPARAAQLGLPYAFADFINRDGAPIATDYQRRFDPGARDAAPRTAVATWALAADTEQEAWELTASSRMAMAMLRRGRLIPIPPVDQALRFLKSQNEDLRSARRVTAGTPEQVRAGLETLAQQYGADEVIVVTITHDHAARRRSYELLADAFGLGASLPRAA